MAHEEDCLVTIVLDEIVLPKNVEPYSDTHDIRMDEVISEMRYDDLSGVSEQNVEEAGMFDDESMVGDDASV